MTRSAVALLCVVAARAAGSDATALLVNSIAAFERNLEHEKHWNWTITETRHLADRPGKAVETFPTVHSESVIQGNGRRCNAVTSWSDGHPAYLKDADPDDRCQAYNAIGTPFQVALLLKSSNAKVTGRSPQAVTIEVLQDKPLQKGRDYNVSCAASIEATIQIDPATSFPLRIEGRVAGSGCDVSFMPVMHDTPIMRAPMISNFRKGSTFRVVYTLQKDRFDTPANSFWITTEQHYDQPVGDDLTVLYYWGRQFRIRTTAGRRLIKDVTTTAQEFGAGSQMTFK